MIKCLFKSGHWSRSNFKAASASDPEILFIKTLLRFQLRNLLLPTVLIHLHHFLRKFINVISAVMDNFSFKMKISKHLAQNDSTSQSESKFSIVFDTIDICYGKLVTLQYIKKFSFKK